jgi:hypothetical protein
MARHQITNKTQAINLLMSKPACDKQRMRAKAGFGFLNFQILNVACPSVARSEGGFGFWILSFGA